MNPTITEAYATRALEACAEHYRLRKEIDAMTTTIGEYLGDCLDAQTSSSYPEIVTHLGEFFRLRKEAMQYDPDYGRGGDPDDGMTESDLEDQCPHCYAALQVIKQRKEVRKRLGVAKQKIMAIGRKGAAV